VGIIPRVVINPFAAGRHLPGQPFSHFAGEPGDLIALVARNVRLLNCTQARADRAILSVTVPPANFFSGIVQLTEGQSLGGNYSARQPGETPRKHVRAPFAGAKAPAQSVEVILYRSDVLAEAATEAKPWGDASVDPTDLNNWEIVSINASPEPIPMPIDPDTLCANYFGEDGGTDPYLDAETFVEALRVSRLAWRDKAHASVA